MSDERKDTAAHFVAQAAGRPMDKTRKRQFAIVRTQSALKITLAEAGALVDDAIAAFNAAAGSEVVPPAAEEEPPAADTGVDALRDSNALMAGAAAQIEALKADNASLKQENAELSNLLTAATAPQPKP
jgi:hypothetical protein